MSIRTIALTGLVLCAWSTADASTVVTQTLERSSFGIWLGHTIGQQSIAHRQVHEEHELIIVPVFDADTLEGADVVYLSPSFDGAFVLSEDEKDALRAYAKGGGRIIAIGDHTIFAEDIGPFAADYDVFYGTGFLTGTPQATGIDATNPLIDGPAGIVEAFNCAGPNDDMRSKNPDFQVVAEWGPGLANAVGYLPVGDGEIVFLSDFNTFDDDMIAMFDNNVFWRNLFLRPAACPADTDGSGTVDTADLLAVLAAWGPCEGCPADVDGSGTVDTADLLAVLAAWGPCDE
jgi:hypothetical protein